VQNGLTLVENVKYMLKRNENIMENEDDPSMEDSWDYMMTANHVQS
jgi:hypothetical protein